jgi:hypothetical protein
MINRLLIFGLLIVLLIMTSCIVYHPQAIDIPLISEKNDLRIDAGISIVPSAHATVSYGLTDKIALQAFGSLGSDERYYFQGAAGIFRKYDNQKVIELYGGFGYGYGSAYRDANPGDLYGDYQQYFLQVNYGKIDCKFANMDYGFGIKAGLLHSNLTDYNYYDFYSETGPFTTYVDNSLLIEPNMFLRLGGENLKFNIKLGSCWINKFTHTDQGLPYSFINLGLGLNYRF